MQIIRTIAELRTWRRSLRHTASTLGLVPTMGALHEGHLSLIRASKSSCGITAATIFVNPLQFAPTEDLAKYPRTFDDDCALLEREGVDILFAPSPEEMYPPGSETFVDVPHIGSRLDGASRPGHFRGVATVVAKLFNLLQPDRAFFGQKDAAQVSVLRAMVRDLNFDIDIITCPTVRDSDGLALSSRNRYLTPQERTIALTLSRALHATKAAIQAGNRNPHTLRQSLHEHLASPDLRLDYADLVDPNTLLPVTTLDNETLIAVAAWVGNTRLIDNILITSAHVYQDVSSRPDPEHSEGAVERPACVPRQLEGKDKHEHPPGHHRRHRRLQIRRTHP